MNEKNDSLRIDLGKVIRDKNPRLAKTLPRFVIAYLKKIIRNHAIKLYHRRHATLPLEVVEEGNHPVADDWDRLWEKEWKRHLFNMALEELKTQVQPETFVAFEMYALQNKPVREVAEFLHMSVSAVYTAKSRCIADMKNIIANLEEH